MAVTVGTNSRKNNDKIRKDAANITQGTKKFYKYNSTAPAKFYGRRIWRPNNHDALNQPVNSVSIALLRECQSKIVQRVAKLFVTG